MLLLALVLLVVPSLGSHLPYIIGGDDVTDTSKWPWQGSLRYYSKHSCGCALISSTWAVTAAHCVGETPITVYNIRFGTLDRNKGGKIALATAVIIHERYGVGSGESPNDIAVISFSPVSVGSTIKPITMATTDQAGNKDCWITGWGYTVIGGGGTLPDILQEAKIDVYTNEKCKQSWGSRINDGHVCVGAQGKGSCNGDSGGPLVCKVGSNYQLVGVTSWGTNDCDTSYPSIYSRISHFRTWVKGKTGV